ncbi:MAG: hypothetical protein Q7R31_02275 [Candidatus Levybacteria bacterium]|nr:hypothetical protein [Candidatus Levybacteria bacterium]
MKPEVRRAAKLVASGLLVLAGAGGAIEGGLQINSYNTEVNAEIDHQLIISGLPSRKGLVQAHQRITNFNDYISIDARTTDELNRVREDLALIAKEKDVRVVNARVVEQKMPADYLAGGLQTGLGIVLFTSGLLWLSRLMERKISNNPSPISKDESQTA